MVRLGWKRYLWLLVTFGLVLCGGCAKGPTTTVVTKKLAAGPVRLLVLPFINNSDEKYLGEIATRVSQEYYFNQGFKLVNQGDLQIYLRRHHLFFSQLTSESSAQIFTGLAHELQVKTLLKGTILSAEYREEQGEYLPLISLQLELLNAADGSLLVSSFLTRSGSDYRTLLRFGVVRTAPQLLERMVTEITAHWKDEGVYL